MKIDGDCTVYLHICGYWILRIGEIYILSFYQG